MTSVLHYSVIKKDLFLNFLSSYVIESWVLVCYLSALFKSYTQPDHMYFKVHGREGIKYYPRG